MLGDSRADARGRFAGCLPLLCFFFSSRRRHTRLQGDWSSDVCSSDLIPVQPDLSVAGHPEVFAVGDIAWITDTKTGKVLPQLGSVALESGHHGGENIARSEERRVGKECRSRWSPYH